MIISKKHRYLFIELPRTGTTAIAHELVENYDGKPILSKHATYQDFVKEYSTEPNDYFIFSCRRNPVDRVYSHFIKMKSGYYDYKSERKLSLYERLYLMPTVKWIKNNNPSFNEFLEKKYTLPYCDWSVLDHDKFDYIIDFHSLNEDFKKALKLCGIQPIRDLPKKNVTKERASLTEIIDKVEPKELKRIFGPFFLENNWTFNGEDIHKRVNKSDILKYKLVKSVYSIYWRYIK